MATVVAMPKLGETMTEGIVESWLKSEGEWVEKGEPLVVIMTEKVTYEFEAPASGILRVILHREGEVIPVATPIAVIAASGEVLPDVETLEREGERLTELAVPLAEKAARPPAGGKGFLPRRWLAKSPEKRESI